MSLNPEESFGHDCGELGRWRKGKDPSGGEGVKG